jgi:hypothetical protein
MELPLTIDELRSMLERCNLAKPGPWRSLYEGRDVSSGSDCISTPAGSIDLAGTTRADQDFIANAREDLPRLIVEVARLKGWTL